MAQARRRGLADLGKISKGAGGAWAEEARDEWKARRADAKGDGEREKEWRRRRGWQPERRDGGGRA